MKIFKRTIIVLLIIVVVSALYFYFQFKPEKNPGWGITFSRPHAEYMGYDWKTMYIDILNDLKPKKLRLVAYWEYMEPENDLWFFQDVDEMLDEADRRGIEVILAVGHKVPRWPECHHPAWYNNLTTDQKNAEHLEMVEVAVNHFRAHDSIKIWQMENEALFDFGEMCPTTSPEFLKQEMEIFRRLDSRPILMSDSGELGRWVPTARLNPDILGSTMYRVVHTPKYGYFEYPLPPGFFRIKAGVTKTFTNVDRFKGVELQAEPWFETDLHRTDLSIQKNLMNPEVFKQNIEYAKRSGLEDHYLWGVEWWYWMAKTHDDWGMWDVAKQTLSS